MVKAAVFFSALIEQVGAWQDVYDSYTFTDIHCDGTLEYSSHSVNRNLPDSGEDVGDGIFILRYCQFII